MNAIPPHSSVRTALAGMVAMAVAMGIGRFVYTPLLPAMMGELGLSASNAGLIASANYVGYLLGAFVAAGAWVRGREHRFMLISLVMSGLLAAAMGMSASLILFLVFRFAAGFASALAMIFVTSIVMAALKQAKRDHLSALHFGGVGVGVSTSAALTAGLVYAQTDWTTGWWAAGVVSLLGAGIVWYLLPAKELATDTSSQAEPRLPRTRSLTTLIAAYGLFGFGYVITATFLVAIVREGGGSALFEAGVWLLTGASIFVSLFIWAPVTRRLGQVGTFALACVVEAIGVMAVVSLAMPVGAVVAAVLFGGTFVAATAFVAQALQKMVPASPRRALALATASFGTGQIIGPPAAGMVADVLGNYFLASGLGTVALLAAAIIAWQGRDG